jgi:hypothetical protein
MKEFLANLANQIQSVNDSSENANLSFPHFLCFLYDDSLHEYNKLLNDLLAGKPCFQKAVLLYTNIITQIENKKSDSVQIDSEGKWLFSMLSFVRAEILYRQDMIPPYGGFLCDGEVKYSNEKLDKLMNFFSPK